ncbi:hypothetical protein AnigIFM56816_011058 [Aspergillus niger]|nr:hypothetical protein AnigIFM56816_011058 [Aspergillus niger]
MWFRYINVQKAFVLSSLLLASGISAAAIPARLADPASVSVTTTNTQAPTGQRDGRPTSLPYEGAPNCQFCHEDEGEQTTGESAMQVKRDSHTIAARTDADEKKSDEEETKEIEKKVNEKCHGNALCEIISTLSKSY